MAVVTGLTAEKMFELATGWDAVADQQTILGGQLTILDGIVGDNQALLDQLNNITLPQLNQDLVDANIILDNLNDVVLPNVQSDLAQAQADILSMNSEVDTIQTDLATLQGDLSNLNTITLPQLQDELDANTDALNTLNTVTLPNMQAALNASLSDLQDQLDTLNDTTIPGLQGQLNTLDGRLDTLDTVTLPGLQGQLNTLDGRLDTLDTVTIPGLNSQLTTLDGRLDTLDTVTIPGLNSQLTNNTNAINTLNTTTIPTLQAELDASQLDILSIETVNKVKNPGFEHDFQGWVTSGSIVIDATEAYRGSKSAKITGAAGLNQVNFPVSPGQTWRFEVWYKTSATWTGSVGNRPLKYPMATNVPGTPNFAQNTNWTKLTFDYTVEADVVGIHPFRLGGTVVSGETLWVDRISCTDVTAIVGLQADLDLAETDLATLEGKFPITGPDIAANAIAANHIQTDAITSNKIVAGAITALKIAANTITAAQIAANTITASEIAANAITADELSANSVTSAHIVAGTIVASDIAAGTITATQIAAGTITTNEIAAGTIVAADIAAGTITATQIAAGTITTNEILAGTILASDIATGTITALQIAADTITANEIAAGTITASEIAADTITANQIAAGAITTSEILAGTILASDIATGTITALQIAADTITANEIAADAITANEIAANAVTANEIAANSISASHIVANSINTGHITTSGLSAAVITTGTMSGDRITVNTLNADRIVANSITGDKIAANTITASKLLVQGENLVTDPTFESGLLTNHTFSTNASWTRSILTTNVRTGTYQVQYDITANFTTAAQAFFSAGSVANPALNHPRVSPGETILCGAWVWMSAGSTVQVRPQIFVRAVADPTTNVATSTGTYTNYSGQGWVFVSREISLSAALTDPNLYIGFQLNVQNGTAGDIMRLDDVIIRKRFAGSLILDGTITGVALVASTITGDKIAANTIAANNIVANTITGDKIAANTISAANIAGLTITGDKIAANAITAAKILAGTITATELAAGSITGDRINATFTITGKEIVGGTITGSKFQTASAGVRMVINDDEEAGSIKGHTGDAAATAPTLINPKILGTGVGRRQVLYMSSGGVGGGIARLEVRSGSVDNTTWASRIFLDAGDTQVGQRLIVDGGSTFNAQMELTTGNMIFTGSNSNVRYPRINASEDARWNGSGELVASSSIRAHKMEIKPLTLTEAQKVLAMEAVSFLWRPELKMGDRRYPGFIAEQAVESGADLWVSGTSVEEPTGVRYKEITAAHNVLIKHLLERIEKLEDLLPLGLRK